MSDVTIEHSPATHRFDLREGGVVIGTAHYRSEEGRRVFHHTVVSPDHQGQGLSSRLIRAALDETRDEGLRIVARCPAVAAYVAKHSDYDDVIDPDESA